MSNVLLNVSGLTTPKVTTDEIILKGKPLGDSSAVEDFVGTVEDYVTEIINGNGNVCRIYKSGWCEQYIEKTINSSGIVTFMRPFQGRPYITVTTVSAPTNTPNDNNFVVNVTSTTTTNCTIKYYDSDSGANKEGEITVIARGFMMGEGSD